MRFRNSPKLSKSRFIAGLQCLKRLYLECHHRELADPIPEDRQAIFDAGHAVGELARRRFPGGVLIAELHYEHTQAVGTTKGLLAGSPVPPLYEAAFEFEGLRVRADILRDNGGGAFDLIEVKATTGVKDAYIPDVAIQRYVIEQSGTPVDRTFVMYLNNQYVYQGGDYALDQLFSLGDVTEEAHRFVAEQVPDDLAKMWEALRQDEAPDVATGRHCVRPYTCPFYGYCHQAGPGPVSGQPYVSPHLASELEGLRYPVSFLDFETFNPALPVYAGTRPYQVIPFQWSLHIRGSDGQLSHRSFLNDDAGDPRERCIVNLLNAVPPQGSIVVYSSYERVRLERLAEEFPRYADPLLALRDRLFDLLPIIREHYYHPAFRGSYSLKSVLPALVPKLSYADLEIQEGTVASIAYNRMIAGDTPEAQKAEMRQSLLAYCQRDTEAMVGVLDALLAESERVHENE